LLEIDYKIHSFKIKEIWFSERPFEVRGQDAVIFKECRNKIEIDKFNCSPNTTLVIDLTKELEEIWKNMSKSSCRYAIRRSLKDGIKLTCNKNFEEFIDINSSFREKKGLLKSELDIEIMKKYGTLITAELEGEILGGQFYWHDADNIRWLVGASKRFEVDSNMARIIGNSNRLMVWEAIKLAKENGMKEFDMGGYYAGKDPDIQKMNINNFKISFGGKLVSHYSYERIYSNLYLNLKKLKNKKIVKNLIKF